MNQSHIRKQQSEKSSAHDSSSKNKITKTSYFMVKITLSREQEFQAGQQALNRYPAGRTKPKIEHK